MSRSSPCRGASPCFSTKRWISSNPAIIRSSRAERPPFFSGWANSASSSRKSSRSRSLIAPLILKPDECRCAFGHPLFPSIRRANRRQPSALLLEFDSPNCQFLRLLRRQAGALGGNRCLHLLQALLAHGLSKD